MQQVKMGEDEAAAALLALGKDNEDVDVMTNNMYD
jgi:hypothetical protein